MEDLIRVAAIDLGTVTARVGIADLRDGELEAIERKSTICNLGEGVDATGQLSQAAIDRVLAAVDDFLQQIKEAMDEHPGLVQAVIGVAAHMGAALQHQYPPAAVLRQPPGAHRPGVARAHNESVVYHQSVTSFLE